MFGNNTSVPDKSSDNVTLTNPQPEKEHLPPFLDDKQMKKENVGLEILKIVLLAIIIVTPVRIFVAQPFVVSGASMDNTFASGQYLIINQLNYRFNEPERGDVVVFHFPLDPSKFFIKRIIGLPDETVILQGKSTIIINEENPEGLVLDENYLSLGNVESDFSSNTLDDGEYFVMGDNRKESYDSRHWGPINKEHIKGQAFVRLFPITKFSILPGQ